MNKKTTKAAETTATAMTAPVARVPQGDPMSVAMSMPQVSLDLKVTTQDLVDIAVGEQSEKLAVDREAIEHRLDVAMREHAGIAKQLGKLAEALIDAQTIDDDTRRLVQLLDSFTGDKHAIKVVSVNAPTYQYASEDKRNEEPEVNLKKQKIIGEVRVVRANKDKTVIVSRRIELDFNQPMQETVRAIEVKADEIREIEKKLTEIKRMIADLPRMGLRAKNELTKAYLRGEIKDTAGMLNTILQTPVKALPCNVLSTVPRIGTGDGPC